MPTMAEILKRQSDRLNKIRARKKAKKKVAKKKIDAPKPMNLGAPVNGDKKWIMNPFEATNHTVDKLAEKFDGKFKDMKKIGEQYGVKGSSKVELAHDIIEVAKSILS